MTKPKKPKAHTRQYIHLKWILMLKVLNYEMGTVSQLYTALCCRGVFYLRWKQLCVVVKSLGISKERYL